MNRRERFHNAVTGKQVDRAPVTVWQHFAVPYMRGDQIAEHNVGFLLHYNLDIAKIVSDYRIELPGGMTRIETVEDFGRIKKISMDEACFAEQINLLKGVRARLGESWPVVDTFFDPIQLILRRAGFSTMKLIEDNPGKALPMIEAATETVIDYVRELKKIGVDGGFYSTRAAATEASSQGFSDEIYNALMRPFDIAILSEMQGMVRMLHACKSHLDLSRVEDYPHEVLSWADRDPTCPTLAQVRPVNDRCLMGGINQSGVIEQSVDQIRADIDQALAVNEGRKFILSPGCTVGSNVPDHVLSTIASYAT